MGIALLYDVFVFTVAQSFISCPGRRSNHAAAIPGFAAAGGRMQQQTRNEKRADVYLLHADRAQCSGDAISRP
jgi:hypothetical protein